jgi:hypothetical protein
MPKYSPPKPGCTAWHYGSLSILVFILALLGLSAVAYGYIDYEATRLDMTHMRVIDAPAALTHGNEQMRQLAELIQKM